MFTTFSFFDENMMPFNSHDYFEGRQATYAYAPDNVQLEFYRQTFPTTILPPSVGWWRWNNEWINLDTEIYLYDRDINRIPLSLALDPIKSCVDISYYYIKNNNALRFAQISELGHMICPEDIGFIVFDENIGEYVEINDEKLINLVKFYNAVKEQMRKYADVQKSLQQRLFDGS